MAPGVAQMNRKHHILVFCVTIRPNLTQDQSICSVDRATLASVTEDVPQIARTQSVCPNCNENGYRTGR